MKRILLIPSFFLIVSWACLAQDSIPPTPIPHGVLLPEIPHNMDIIFDSIRYVLNDPACLDENYAVDRNFINLPGCNALIYDSEDDGLASPRQLFAMDLETGEVAQFNEHSLYFYPRTGGGFNNTHDFGDMC